MRKYLIVMLVVTFCFSGVISGFAGTNKGYEAAVILVSGYVEVDIDDNNDWENPYVGMKLKKGTILKTGSDGYAELVFDSEGLNMLQIKENSKITVDKSMVKLAGGSVLAIFDNLKSGSTFSVKTPNAVCGIRGSMMGVEYIKGLTVTRAFEHKVYVQGVDDKGAAVGKEIIIPEGWKTKVFQQGDITPPSEITDNEKKIFEAWVDKMKEKGKVPPEKRLDKDMDPENKDLKDITRDEKKPDISPCGIISSRN